MTGFMLCSDKVGNGIIKTDALYVKLGKSKMKECGMQRKEVLNQVTFFIRYYNEARPKKRLGGLSPAAFREQNPDGTWLTVLPESTQA